jgi:hypothetical protein
MSTVSPTLIAISASIDFGMMTPDEFPNFRSTARIAISPVTTRL